MHGADDAAAGDHTVAALQRRDHLPRLLLLLLLRPDQQEVEHHEDQYQRQELRGAAEHVGDALRVCGGDEHRHWVPGLPGLRRDHSLRPLPVKFPGPASMDQRLTELATRIAEALERLAPPRPAAGGPGSPPPLPWAPPPPHPA